MTPPNDAIIAAVAELVDDSQLGRRRDPSHSDLEFLINRAHLGAGDPKQNGQVVGKAKRIRGTLSWALEHEPESGGNLVVSLVNYIRGQGGFREDSPNFVGRTAIATAIEIFGSEGYELSLDGELRPKLLDNLSGPGLTQALESYVRRAKRGSDDAALVTGTGKDLLWSSGYTRPSPALWERFADIEFSDSSWAGLFRTESVYSGRRCRKRATDATNRECHVRAGMWHQSASQQARHGSWTPVASGHFAG